MFDIQQDAGGLKKLSLSLKLESSFTQEDIVPVLVPEVFAAHANMPNSNSYIYPMEELLGSDKNDPEGKRLLTGYRSATWPYNKPFLRDHDHSDTTGFIVHSRIGYNKSAKRNALILYPAITDVRLINDIINGRRPMVSIGMRVARGACNICGAPVENSFFGGPMCDCEHEFGQFYDNVEAGANFYDITIRECSSVGGPADEFAGINYDKLMNGEYLVYALRIIEENKAVVSEAYMAANDILLRPEETSAGVRQELKFVASLIENAWARRGKGESDG